MAKSKSRNKRRSGGGRSKGIDPMWLVAGAAVLVAGGVYLATSGSASAATPPRAPLPAPVSARGTTPSRPRPRSATTAAKPQMSAEMLNLVTNNQITFWFLAALYTLDRAAGAPNATKMRRLINNSFDFDDDGKNALARLGIRLRTDRFGNDEATLLSDLQSRLGSRRIELPYQVPSDVWAYVNVFLRDVSNSNSESFEEPV